MLRLRFVLAALVAFAAVPASAQTAQTYEILGVEVDGVTEDSEQTFIISIADLRPGERVQLPYDEAFGEAVRGLYERAQVSDAEITVDRVVGDGVFLTIRVTQEPRLGVVEYEGLSKGEQDELRDRLPLIRGRRVRPADVEQSRLIVQSYLREKGFRLSSVSASQKLDGDRLTLTLAANKGDRVEVEDVVFVGNENFSERTLRKRLKNTPEDRWWRFWKRETFTQSGFEEDKDALIRYYNDRGYYGARVVRDSVYLRTPEASGEDPELVVELEIDEGPKYHVREVVFEGNTLYTDEQLEFALGIEPGDVYNRSLIDRNLYYSPDHSDVASLYTDRGYLRFNVAPQVVEVPGDSLDIYVEITEGDVYEFGTVEIAGNTRTKEHVIRREIRTVPGQTYSRQAIERSVRDLVQLNYFDQSSIGGGPAIRPNDEDKTVDLTYSLAETSSDQLELSGGYGGSLGLLLTAKVTFNNFSAQGILDGSAWKPIPAGDGQQLSLQVVTSGTRYQNYTLAFTEPWFRGRPTPVGFSLGFQNFSNSPTQEDYKILLGTAQVFARTRLKWPDDYFQTGTTLGYRIYDIDGRSNLYGLPEGVSQELTVRQTLSRNNLDNPLFPQAGSRNELSVTIAPPVPGFIQYHKTDLESNWYAPLANKLSLSLKTKFGYIGSLTGEDVEFQRYLVGGSPLETNRNFVGFGKDLVYLRGYPTTAIGPRSEGEPVGGRILNVFQTELQYVALQTPQLSVAPYVFADAANSYDGFSDYDPARLYRSAGFGARVILPILGLVDLNYGYGIDPFDPVSTRDDGLPKWRGQVTLGAGL
ncbi:outer membrane protein assembly factor BamA [Rubricoccus marinus]|uniref:Outer membrane protein assembly factor BamA n=1 Tax=Rubricoccus marinus TaxID=716817 RepID=A0A259TYV9_9BACT|nr:outer membrane protein assembly factor BamA [Rubricoccus marinus]OZC02942.1 outer membrane protein assembly factor BamA [Rubricoccus marinus]